MHGEQLAGERIAVFEERVEIGARGGAAAETGAGRVDGDELTRELARLETKRSLGNQRRPKPRSARGIYT